MLIKWWALRAEEQDYCVSKILKKPPHHEKKKRQKDAKEAMAKPSSGFPYLPKIHMDSKIHTAVTG